MSGKKGSYIPYTGKKRRIPWIQPIETPYYSGEWADLYLFY